MIQRLLRYVYYILFFSVPLLMSPLTSELFEFNKLMLIYCAAVFVFLLCGLKMVIKRTFIFRRTPFDVVFILFLLSQILSTIFSIDIHTSIFGYYGRFNGGLISIIAYLVLYYGFVTSFDREFVIRALKLNLVSSFIVILYGIPGKLGVDISCILFTQKFNNSCWTDQFRPAERMFSTLGQPNWLGQYLLIFYFIGFYFYQTAKKRKHEIIWFVYLLLNAMCIFFTRSRSAIGVLGISTVLAPFFMQPIKKKVVYLLVALGASVLLFKTGVASVDKYISLSTYMPKKPVITSQKTIQKDNLHITESFDIRKIVWEGAVTLGKKYPLFGTGVETFAYSYNFVRPKEHNLTSEWDFIYNKAHNEYLNYLATTGFIGLGTYLLMIAAVLIFFIRHFKKEPFMVPFLFAYISVLITNFVGFSTSTISLFLYIFPAMAVVIVIPKAEAKEHKLTYSPKDYLIGFGVLLLSVSSLIYLATYYIADMTYARATVFYNQSDYQSAGSLLQSALAVHYEHVYQDKLSYSLANVAYEYAGDPKEADYVNKLKNAADYYNIQSIKASPKNTAYWKTRAKNQYLFYEITSDRTELEKGVSALEAAKLLSPADPKISYSEAVYFSLLEGVTKDTNEKKLFSDRAFAEVNRTISLKPDYYDGYLLKGQMLKKEGRKEEAKQLFELMIQKFGKTDEIQKEIESLS